MNWQCSAFRTRCWLPNSPSASHLLPSPVTLSKVAKRFRSDSSPKKRKEYNRNDKPYSPLVGHNANAGRPKYQTPPESFKRLRLIPQRPLTRHSPPEVLTTFFEQNVEKWSSHPRVTQRLLRFAIPEEHIKPILKTFIHDVKAGLLRGKGENNAILRYGIDRFGRVSESEDFDVYYDMIYTTVLYAWVVSPPEMSSLHTSSIPPPVLEQMRALSNATQEFTIDYYQYARGMRRHFIMHVGPTNSGKTHNALRALAAAPSGIYAGPLRLLAHEIWERLNLGQIVPAGVEEEPAKPVQSAAEDSLLDIPSDTPTVTNQGDSRYARPCNMLTGEEIKIVSSEAKLTSSTVEMINIHAVYDVAVIDEIQMIADIDRGFAWTNAVLGLNAYEIHLCGEETAIPIIQELLAETGDTIEVRRYKRLTPLRVEEKSLDGDLSKVRPGDCLVTFSRSSIFETKRDVERKTGLRAATIYGKLPPEVRSEQADMFNNVDGGCDVLIGSDAIGLGLNLKIRRMIFTSVHKNTGRFIEPLAVSALKQIAGRAGRFGLHNPDETPEGLVTTLRERDLPQLKHGMSLMPSALATARITFSANSLGAVSKILPRGTALRVVGEAHLYTSRIPAYARYRSGSNFDKQCNWLENAGGVSDHRALFDGDMALTFLLLNAPIPWRDPGAVPFCKTMLHLFQTDMYVPLREASAQDGFLEHLENLEAMSSSSTLNLRDPASDLSKMECFHHILGMYMWLSFRRPASFPDVELVQELMPRVQKTIVMLLNRGFQTEKQKLEGRLTRFDVDRIVLEMEDKPTMKKIEYTRENMHEHDTNVREKLWSEYRKEKVLRSTSG